MQTLSIKIKNESFKIDKTIFIDLLDTPVVKNLSEYVNVTTTNKTTIKQLKFFAEKACIPYPLFFAPRNVVDRQIKNNESNLMGKLPTKLDIKIGSRGTIVTQDIELIVKDIARKQEFLKRRVLKLENDNYYIGSIAKMIESGSSFVEIADFVRDYFEINLSEMRKFSKADALSYLVKKIELKNVFVSKSSHNFMPQNIDPNAGVSGVCIKDKKFPFIFINTRDGDENPLILESDGRKMFTLVSMLICIGLNKFILSMGIPSRKDTDLKRVYTIVSEVLLPSSELGNIIINNIDELKKYSQQFKVTPSMLLVKIRELGLIPKADADLYSETLAKEIKKKSSSRGYPPTPVTGYAKYNGERFSQEVVRSQRAGDITSDDLRGVLFRRGKVDPSIIQKYCNEFK